MMAFLGFSWKAAGRAMLRVTRKNILVAGLIWGLVEGSFLTLGVLALPSPDDLPFWAFPPLIDIYSPLVLLLILVALSSIVLAFSTTYLQGDAYKSMRSFLVAQLFAQPIFLWTIFGAAHPDSLQHALSEYTGPPSTSQIFHDPWAGDRSFTFYIIMLELVLVFVQILSVPLGYLVAEGIKDRRRRN